jgi:hypothetical protein
MKRSWLQRFRASTAYTQANIICTIIIAVATVIYAIIAGFQLSAINRQLPAIQESANAAKRAAKTASESLDASRLNERPWLAPSESGTVYNPLPKDTVGFKVRFTNGGRTPATSVAIQMQWFVGLPLPVEGDPATLPQNPACQNGVNPKGHYLLLPGIPLDHVSEFPPEVNAAMKDIRKNIKGLYLIGCVFYYDPSGKGSYRTNISEMFIHGTEKFPDSLRLSASGNDAY